MLYYGRVLTSGGMSASEASYVDFSQNRVFAGFSSSPDTENYVRLANEREMIAFNIENDAITGSQKRIPGFFTMLGGPAYGPNALVKILQHYGWSKVALYFQNGPEELVLSETVVTLSQGIEFVLRKRESAGASTCGPTDPPATRRAVWCGVRDL